MHCNPRMQGSKLERYDHQRAESEAIFVTAAQPWLKEWFARVGHGAPLRRSGLGGAFARGKRGAYFVFVTNPLTAPTSARFVPPYESVSVNVQVGVGVIMLFSFLYAYTKHAHRLYSKLAVRMTDEDESQISCPVYPELSWRHTWP